MIVSYGGTHPAIITRSREIEWPEFAKWLTEAPGEYADKAARGWYIPASFLPVYRSSENFVARHAITFDFDHVGTDTWQRVLDEWFNVPFAIYTTFSHSPEAPRFRVVMPLNRPAGYDEFQAVARLVATDVGIELIARESFVPAQMMYAPARRPGGSFESFINPGTEYLDVDSVLAEYKDWTDETHWPRRKDGDAVHAAANERIDARDKPGIIGEFNRAFSITQAIERFELPYRRVR